jgi:hypothetical protein
VCYPQQPDQRRRLRLRSVYRSVDDLAALRRLDVLQLRLPLTRPNTHLENQGEQTNQIPFENMHDI